MTDATAPNPSTAQARVFVDELARCGVTDAVLAPGSRSTALALAFDADPRIRLHVQIDERSAGFLAIGLARATARPAAVITTSGSATANLHPAVTEADTGGVPLLLLTSDRPPELRHTAANQTIDQIKLYGDAVRWSVEVGTAEDRPGVVAFWRSTVARAVAEAGGVRDRPGPVHLNLAFREPTVPHSDDGRMAVAPFTQPLDGRRDNAPWVAVTRPSRTLAVPQVQALAARIASTERGLIVLGDTAADLGPALDLADRAAWPVIAEPLANVRTDDRVISHASLLLADPGFRDAHRPDLAIRVGRTGLSRGLSTLLTDEIPQLLVDADGTWLDPGRAVHEVVVADPTRLLADVAAALAADAGSDWRDRWQRADAAAARAVADLLDADDAPSEPRTARDVAAAVPDRGTLVVASSMPIRDLDAHLRPRTGLRIVGNRGTSGIDGFVSTVLGVALGTDGPTVALAGDLSLLHDSNGFLLSPGAAQLDATIVVVDNDGGGIFSFLPQADEPAFERVFGTPHGRDLEQLARFHDLGYRRVDRAVALPEAVAEAVAAGGPQLVHVRTDRQVNRELHARIATAVSEAIRA